MSFPWARERVNDQASEQMSEAERASKASSTEQANERANEQMAQYSLRQFHIIFTHRAMIWSTSSKTDLVHVNYLLFICQNLNISFPAMFIQNETTNVWYHGIEVTCFVLHRSLESEVTSKPVWWHFLLSLLLFFHSFFLFFIFLSFSFSFFLFFSLSLDDRA